MSSKMTQKPFNSRPHKEVDGIQDKYHEKYKTFQFTTSQGGRLPASFSHKHCLYFQFTTSQGGRQARNMRYKKPIVFQFTTSQGGRRGRRHPNNHDRDLSIHDLTRRSTAGIVLNVIRDGFQFTTSQGGRLVASYKDAAIMNFQFTTSQGGRLYSGTMGCMVIFFQFTTSQGGRHRTCSKGVLQRPFNSRPHKEVDDTKQLCSENICDLSIHDLTRRSTTNTHRNRKVVCPFNSRPHKEVDFVATPRFDIVSVFQFTTSQGGRRHLRAKKLTEETLSIHDLTRRSTLPFGMTLGEYLFQFTTSQGGRLHKGERVLTADDFQFTTSQGGRPGNETPPYYDETFNSRPHKEVDVREDLDMLLEEDFQFTTSQGGRRTRAILDYLCQDLSIHDLTRRSTTRDRRNKPKYILSIHDLTRRSTTFTGTSSNRTTLSIHDLTRRSTPGPV